MQNSKFVYPSSPLDYPEPLSSQPPTPFYPPTPTAPSPSVSEVSRCFFMLPTVSKTNSEGYDQPGIHSVRCNSISQSERPEPPLGAGPLPKRATLASLWALPGPGIWDLRADVPHMSTGREKSEKGKGTRLQRTLAPV